MVMDQGVYDWEALSIFCYISFHSVLSFFGYLLLIVVDMLLFDQPKSSI